MQVLSNDKISKIIKDNLGIEKSGKNKFEFAVANILNIKYLAGIDFEDMIDGMTGSGGEEGIYHAFDAKYFQG
ncbi:MAG: hypothetical protein NT145_06500 [Elusimicrobia bacterium]|nr:hypothetical protein [Elusimicrobiota bacterium]